VPLLAVECTIDYISGIAQRSCELTIEIRIVLNDEQAQFCLQTLTERLAPISPSR